MTREEQRRVKEVRKQLEVCIKRLTKGCGFQKINGYVYKFVGDFVYVAILSIPPVDAGKNLRIDFFYKPWILDEVFWDVFNVIEGPKQPMSFHVQGAFTAPLVLVENYKVAVSSIEDMDTIYGAVLGELDGKIEEHHQRVYDLKTFLLDLESYKHQFLNRILAEIYQQRYRAAIDLLEIAIFQGETGGFADSSQKNILQYALGYCQKLINEE